MATSVPPPVSASASLSVSLSVSASASLSVSASLSGSLSASVSAPPSGVTSLPSPAHDTPITHTHHTLRIRPPAADSLLSDRCDATRPDDPALDRPPGPSLLWGRGGLDPPRWIDLQSGAGDADRISRPVSPERPVPRRSSQPDPLQQPAPSDAPDHRGLGARDPHRTQQTRLRLR
ncbi:MAG TPA: hypothetical protein ENK18_17040 [Deltaproteobacteria bacterium]|nr:hypothetical protein [Deltaproteobacteria bacterium]